MKLPKELTTVTPLSTITVLIVFVGLILIGFLFGIIYKESDDYGKNQNPPTQLISPKPTSTVDVNREPTGSAETANWKTYTNQSLGFSIKYPHDANYTIKEKDTCIDFGVPETDNVFSVCRYILNGRNLEQWLKQETVSSNPSCRGLYETCGEIALNYGDLKLTNLIVNNYKAIKVEQTENSYKTKYNVIRTPKVYIFTTNNSEMFEIDGTYDDQILSAFKFTEQ